MALFRTCFVGKNILITGATRGLGKALTGTLHGCEANVFALAKSKERLKYLKTEYPGIVPLCADLRDWNATRNIVSRITVPLHGVINNAGAGLGEGLMQVTPESFDTAMHTNVRAVMNISQVVVPKMIEAGRGGSIVNISSMTAFRGTKLGISYSTSKCALNMLTRVMALELGKHKIRVNAVCPAGFESDLLLDTMDGYYGKGVGMEIRNKAMTKRTPLGKALLEIDEIVNATLFMLSDLVPMMTGESLLIDGGFTCS